MKSAFIVLTMISLKGVLSNPFWLPAAGEGYVFKKASVKKTEGFISGDASRSSHSAGPAGRS